MRWLTLKLAVVVSALILPTAACQAAPIASESFIHNISQGGYISELSILGQSPTVGSMGFVGPWVNPTTEAFVPRLFGLSHPLTPEATYDGDGGDGRLIAYTDDEGWANRRLSREIDYTPTDGTYYMSVLLQTDQERDIDFLAGLAPSETYYWSFGSIQGTYVGIQDGNISFLTTSHIHYIVPHAQVNVGETYFALMQFDYSNSGPDTATATIYDGSAAKIGEYTKTNLNLDGDITHFGVLTSDFSPEVSIDEWRFGTELSDVMAQPLLAGDYNGDGVVNAADYTVWRDHLGSSVTLPNDPTPGMVTQEDYQTWKDNFGNTASMSVSIQEAAVPEPMTGILLSLGIVAMFLGRRRVGRKVV